MEKLLELIEEIKERISVLEGDEEEIDEKYEQGFDPMDWSGGNFDDAYNEGQEDGEVWAELRVLRDMLLKLEKLEGMM